jgi:hypothetical protein
MTAYRWRGVTRDGASQFGRFTTDPALLAGVVEDRFNKGWRHLTVCSGDGPLPPSFADQCRVAEIGPHPATGQRTWWSEL